MLGIIALKVSGRDCTNNNELLHIIGVLQHYAMHLFVFTKVLYNQFDGAVSITVVLRETDNKVEGSSPSKTFFIFFILFIYFLLLQICRKFFMSYMFAKKTCLMSYARVKRLHSVKWRSLYGDTAMMQELLLKMCTSSALGRKLSLNRV